MLGPTSVCQALEWLRVRVPDAIIGIPWAFLYGGNGEQTGSNSLLFTKLITVRSSVNPYNHANLPEIAVLTGQKIPRNAWYSEKS